MQSIWLSLVWKEWREYRWKLAALSAVMIVLPLFFEAWLGDNSLQTSMTLLLGTLFCYGFSTAMFLGMNVAARENGVGTIGFLRSLPIPAWKAASAKLLVASIVATIPIVLLIALSYGYCRAGFIQGVDVTDHFISLSIDPKIPTLAGHLWHYLWAAVIGTLSLLWWVAALGVNRSDEIRAGAIGFLGFVVIWSCGGYLLRLADKHQLQLLEDGLVFIIAAFPAGILMLIAPDASGPLTEKAALMFVAFYAISLIGHVGVVGWFLYRFGRVSPKTGRGEEVLSKTAVSVSLKAPFKSQLSAIAWKQMRETGPLAVLALPAILAMSGFAAWVSPHEWLDFSLIFLQAVATMSFFVVLVAGIGLYLEELTPGLNHFWRSRPNDLRLWFWMKYLSGILVLITILGIPLFLAGWSQLSEFHNPERNVLWGGTLFGVWFFVITYSLAMTYQCLVRQPIYAVVLTLATLWLVVFVLNDPFDVKPHPAMVATGMIVSLAVVVALAWKTVKHDWGWKS
jgi:hypothetical protein